MKKPVLGFDVFESLQKVLKYLRLEYLVKEREIKMRNNYLPTFHFCL